MSKIGSQPTGSSLDDQLDAVQSVRFRAFRLHAGAPSPEGRVVDMAVHELSAGNVVIRVAYSSINYKDALAAAGRNDIVKHYPRVGGIDLSGR